MLLLLFESHESLKCSYVPTKHFHVAAANFFTNVALILSVWLCLTSFVGA